MQNVNIKYTYYVRARGFPEIMRGLEPRKTRKASDDRSECTKKYTNKAELLDTKIKLMMGLEASRSRSARLYRREFTIR